MLKCNATVEHLPEQAMYKVRVTSDTGIVQDYMLTEIEIQSSKHNKYDDAESYAAMSSIEKFVNEHDPIINTFGNF